MAVEIKETNLRKLLKANLNQLSTRSLQQFDNESDVKKVKDCIKQQSSQMKWSSFRKEILGQLENLLDIPLHTILTRSWESCEKVKKIAEIQIASGLDSTSIVPLQSHKIRSHQQPQMTLNIENCETTIFPLSIALELSFSNVVVKLQHGKIKSILSGLCEGTGIVKYGEILLAERDIITFHLTENFSKNKEINAPSFVL